MITVLAERKDDRSVRAVTELPALDGQLEYLLDELGAESNDEINIRYAGSDLLRVVDEFLFINQFENKYTGSEISIDELNLLSYLLARMDKEQLSAYNDAMQKYDTVPGMDNIINEAYKAIAYATGDEDLKTVYDGSNAAELINAERALVKPYPDMSVDVFWKMIGDAREKYGDDTEEMENHLTRELSHMSPHDIRLYKDINDEYILHADTGEIYKAGSELNGGLSDDGFIDFRGWLISQGKDVYTNTLNDPNFLAKMKLKPINYYYEWETFNYIASDAYKMNNGGDLYKQLSVITDEQKNEIVASANEDEDEILGEDEEFGGVNLT